MRDEKRLKQFNVKIRPSLDAIARADAAAKGQALSIWFERLIEKVVVKKKELADQDT